MMVKSRVLLGCRNNRVQGGLLLPRHARCWKSVYIGFCSTVGIVCCAEKVMWALRQLMPGFNSEEKKTRQGFNHDSERTVERKLNVMTDQHKVHFVFLFGDIYMYISMYFWFKQGVMDVKIKLNLKKEPFLTYIPHFNRQKTIILSVWNEMRNLWMCWTRTGRAHCGLRILEELNRNRTWGSSLSLQHFN